jgi:hypothetical protein
MTKWKILARESKILMIESKTLAWESKVLMTESKTLMWVKNLDDGVEDLGAGIEGITLDLLQH